jgi:hypothetical protein
MGWAVSRHYSSAKQKKEAMRDIAAMFSLGLF